MNFTLFSFWGSLIGGVLVILLIRSLIQRCGWDSRRFDRLSLCVLNLGLLGSESRLTLLIFTAVLVLTYLTLLWLRKSDFKGFWRHTALCSLVAVQFLPLLYYKYGYFVATDIFHAEKSAGFFRQLIIPAGLSFYTFQMISVVFDYAKDHTRFPSFLNYCNFAGFFPQIVAGPIERRDQLLPQMEKFRWTFRWIDAWSGLQWLIVGLFFKLSLAENLAMYSKWCSAPSDNAYLIWLGSALFGLRIYFDFAGYSLIAVGLGRMLGVQLQINFWSPYTAITIQDFWRRWHRTLSGWFRDYVYLPLGGGRSRVWAFNILLVFVVSGIWHGAGFNFILWGCSHGLLLVMHRLLNPVIIRIPKPVCWLFTMWFVALTWLFFYQTDWGTLVAKMAVLVRPGNYCDSSITDALRTLRYDQLFGILVWSCLSIGTIILEFAGLRVANNPYHYFRSHIASAVLVACIILTAPVEQNAFIYFNF